MRKYFFVVSCLFALINFTGCAALKPAAQVSSKAGGVVPLSVYSGPKARITVADFEVKTALVTSETGSGLREMLVTALTDSNRFSLIERQSLQARTQEKELSNGGIAQQGEGALHKDKGSAADLIITAAVTQFEPQGSGGSGGIGGGGGAASGILGGLLGASMNKAHLALDIRIVDAFTSAILASTRVQGQATDVAGGTLVDFFDNWTLGTGLGEYSNTPMEKAIRLCIIEAVRYVSQTIPASYYKY